MLLAMKQRRIGSGSEKDDEGGACRLLKCISCFLLVVRSELWIERG